MRYYRLTSPTASFIIATLHHMPADLRRQMTKAANGAEVYLSDADFVSWETAILAQDEHQVINYRLMAEIKKRRDDCEFPAAPALYFKRLTA